MRDVIWAVFIGFWIGLLSGFGAGNNRTLRECQQEAIKAGVGRWSIDEETGERKFVYGAK